MAPSSRGLAAKRARTAEGEATPSTAAEPMAGEVATTVVANKVEVSRRDLRSIVFVDNTSGGAILSNAIAHERKVLQAGSWNIVFSDGGRFGTVIGVTGGGEERSFDLDGELRMVLWEGRTRRLMSRTGSMSTATDC